MNLGISNENDEPLAPPPYLSLYNLSLAPFSPGSEGAFFYADPQSTHILSALRDLSESSNGVTLVCGPGGSGKSTLLQQFLDHVPEDRSLCYQQAKKGHGAEILLDNIYECFERTPIAGIPEQQLEDLREYLSGVSQEEPTVIVIDDAHLLSEDALFILTQLATAKNETGSVTRVLLFAEPSIDTVINSEPFAGYPEPQRFELQPLDEMQTAIYLNHRLEAAGYQGGTIFSNSEIKQIHRVSGGIAGRINEEAHNVMMLHWQAGGSAGSNARRYLKIGLTVFAAVVLVIVLREFVDNIGETDDSGINQKPDAGKGQVAESAQTPDVNSVPDNARDTGVNQGGADSEKVEIPIALPPVKSEDGIRVMGEVQPQKSASVNQSEQEALTKPAGASERSAAVESSGTKPDEEMALVVKPKKPVEVAQGLRLTGIKPSPLIVSNTPQRIIIEGTGFVEGSRIALNRAGQVTLIPESQVEWISDKALAITIETGKAVADWAVQVGTPDNRLSNVLFFKVTVPENQSVSAMERAPGEEKASRQEPATVMDAKPVSQSTVKSASTTKNVTGENTTQTTLLGSDWLTKQPKQNYTLQLLASNSRYNVTTFIREHQQLQAPLASIATKKDGSHYYVLIQGSYTTRALAERAAGQLPDNVDSWPRVIESLQQEMVSDGQAGAQSPVTPAPGQGRIKDTAWVWSQDPARYTVQLAAAENEQSIEAVTRQLDLPGELVVVRTLHQGKHWYVLIYGSFESKDAAHASIDKLPISLQNTGPWARSFASLQSELSRATP